MRCAQDTTHAYASQFFPSRGAGVTAVSDTANPGPEVGHLDVDVAPVRADGDGHRAGGHDAGGPRAS